MHSVKTGKDYHLQAKYYVFC
uniref:Uncharacterized protein n=1 Tax=Arundo donax TaxID=35708 RepID=A0A0A9BR96_ARUDO